MNARRPAVLNVVNFSLPAGDYRVEYARMRRPRLRVLFGIPTPPAGIPDEDVVPMPFGEGLHWHDLATFARLFRVLRSRRQELDLVHFYSTKLILVGPVLAAAAGVPSVVTVTGFGRIFSADTPAYRACRVLYRLAFATATRLARAVLFQNRADLDATVAATPRLAPKAHYVGSATATPVAVLRPRPREALHVVHVARLLPSKGIEDFVAVATALRDEPVEFTLVGGPSDDYPQTERLVADAAERGVLTYLGRVDSAALGAVYDGADVIFFPSYGEGMARVMLEAGMRGLCPVAYDIAANRDLVADERGFLLPVGDTEGAASVLRSLAADARLVQENAAAFQQHVRRLFSMDAFAARLDEVLRTCLGDATAEAGR